MKNSPKIAVVLASYIADENYLQYCDIILNILKKEFADADIYVGINPCPFQETWQHKLAHSGLSVVGALTPAQRLWHSDASAYQTALSLLRASGKTYDFVWFLHTKGATSQSVNDLAAQLIELLLKKETVLASLLANAKNGLYATSAVVLPKAEGLVSRYMPFKFSPLAISPIYSFYVLRGPLLQRFLANCQEAFFQDKLPSAYFFEFDFPQIVFMQGYLPVVRQIVQVGVGELARVRSTPDIYRRVVSNWQAVNQIRATAVYPA